MMTKVNNELTFTSLIDAIQHIHDELAAQASRAVNVSLTLRNWLIGFYIREYEQNGADRASYGDKLLDRLSEALTKVDLKRMDVRELRRYRQFYLVYPQIQETLTPELTTQFQLRQKLGDTDSRIVPPATEPLSVSSSDLLHKLSFSHIVELIAIDNDTSRALYEIECIRGNWSVRELKRQINSLYYERSGLSKDKKKLAELAQSAAEAAEPALVVRDPYIFEFLGLKPQEVMSESHLEDQLLDKLQEFLLEMGHGFCFEARQKRILIGDTHNFVDLVFYHRILKCHVLVELKLEEFNHANVGQINTYLSWYQKNMMTDGDNPPVGILLCTKKDHTLVQYALAGMDNKLFVSKYQMELPKKEDMQKFVAAQLKEV